MIVKLKRLLFARFWDEGCGSARIPDWARKAGMPPPHDGEGFDEYTKRIGLEPEKFIRRNERYRNLANMRLAAYLTRMFPSYFEKDMEEKRRKRLGS